MKYVNSVYNKLNKCTNFNFNGLCSTAYNGEGFYVNHRTKVNKIQPIYGYDIHWAYGGALINYIFPLDNEMTDEETPLGIFEIEFSYMNPKYDDFYYTLYQNNKLYRNRHLYTMFLTNLDWEIFKDLYDTDAQIVGKTYFKHIGPLSDDFKDYVKLAYIDKKNASADDKPLFEACFYGLFAKNLNKDYQEMMRLADKTGDRRNWVMAKKAQEKYHKAFLDTGVEDVRNKYVPIAMFQTAYLRLREWNNFKKYIDTVVYMNTDSIYCDSPIDIATSHNIGEYDTCYDGNKIQFIRRNAYVVFDKNDNIKEQILGGIDIKLYALTQDDLNKLKDGETVTCKTKNEKHEIIDIPLKPLFLLNVLNEIILK